jgi:hypothetical protein
MLSEVIGPSELQSQKICTPRLRDFLRLVITVI